MAVEVGFCDGAGGRASKKNGFFLRCRVVRQKTMAVFCAAGLHVKKRWPFSAPQGCMSRNGGPFSAPQGCMSRNDGHFLRRRVASQETVARFLRRRVASQETVVRFLRRRVASQETVARFLRRRFVPIKNRFPQQVRSISVLKIFSFAHFFLHLPTSFLNNKHQ